MTAAVGKLADKPSQRRDVVCGDHVYYQHPEDGLKHGEVISVGEHGFRTRRSPDGGSDAVTWGQMVGHKLRKQRKFTLVDRGEDGSIVEDEAGQRVFLRGDTPEPMAKSAGLISALAPSASEQMQVLALELARTQLEQTNLLVAAMDRVASAVAAQTARLDSLIALQVAALNDGASDARSVLQGDHPAQAAG